MLGRPRCASWTRCSAPTAVQRELQSPVRSDRVVQFDPAGAEQDHDPVLDMGKRDD